MKDAAEFKEIEQTYKVSLDKISERIRAIESQTNHAQKSETDLMSTIEKIFQESTRKIKEADVVVVQPKTLTHRLTQTLKPVTKDQDRVYPAADALNYDNYLIAVRDALKQTVDYNFVFKNGSATEYKSTYQLTEVPI